jgi:hypothetical protein
VPSSKIGHFSHENYADREILSANGMVKTERRASALLPSVERLSSKQWHGIITAAKQFAFEDDVSALVAVTQVDDGESDSFLLCESESELGEYVDEYGDGDQLPSDPGELADTPTSGSGLVTGDEGLSADPDAEDEEY